MTTGAVGSTAASARMRMRTAPVAARSTRRDPPPVARVAQAVAEIWLPGSAERSPAVGAAVAGVLAVVGAPPLEPAGVAGDAVGVGAGVGVGTGVPLPPAPLAEAAVTTAVAVEMTRPT